MTLHKNIIAARKASGLTQREAARRADINVKVLSSWESGRRIRSMRVWQLVRLAGVYGVAPADLIPNAEIVNTRPAPPYLKPEPLTAVTRAILRGLGR